MKAVLTMNSFQEMVREILGGIPRFNYVNPELNLSVRDFRGWSENYGYGVNPTGPMEVYFDGQPLPKGEALLRRYGFV